MRKGMKSVSILVALAIASSAEAQIGKAFYLNGHVGRGMGSEVTIKSVGGLPTGGQKFETKAGMAMGLVAGYAFTPQLSLYGTLSQANQDVKNTTDDVTLRHLGVGARYSLGEQSPRLFPYLAGEAGQRSVAGEDCTGGGCTDFSMTGIYFGGGAGLLYFFNPAFAFDGSLNVSVGGFTDSEDAGVSADIKTDSPMNIRVLLGVSWFPTKKK